MQQTGAAQAVCTLCPRLTSTHWCHRWELKSNQHPAALQESCPAHLPPVPQRQPAGAVPSTAPYMSTGFERPGRPMQVDLEIPGLHTRLQTPVKSPAAAFPATLPPLPQLPGVPQDLTPLHHSCLCHRLGENFCMTLSSSRKAVHDVSAVTFTPPACPVVGIAGMSQLPAHQLHISLNRHEKCSRSRDTAEKSVSAFNANITCPHGVSLLISEIRWSCASCCRTTSGSSQECGRGLGQRMLSFREHNFVLA